MSGLQDLANRVGRGRFRPLPPSDPYVKVSLHTAQAHFKAHLRTRLSIYSFLTCRRS